MSKVFSPGELIALLRAEQTGCTLEEEIYYWAILLGIMKASLNTQSFISEASFQETAWVFGLLPKMADIFPFVGAIIYEIVCAIVNISSK